LAITPDRTAVTSGGASRYASGSQPWNGEERRLDHEGEHEAQEDPAARARWPVDQVERADLEAVDDDRGEHHQRARHRVDEELDGCAEAAGASPHPDEDVERDQHRLEEGVDEEEVLRDEDADGRTGEEEHQPEVGARAVAADPEAVADARGHRDDRQPDEPERESVLPDVVRDVEVLDPGRVLRELNPAPREVEARGLLDPDPHLGERDEHRERAGRVPRERQQPDHQCGADRQPDQKRSEGRDGHRTTRKTIATTAMPVPRKST
jgi:hypothetical protein